MKISVRSPTRVDLAGGTLDCWPLYLLLGDCVTVNLAISVATTVELTPRADEKVQISVKDLGYKREFNNPEEAWNCTDEPLRLIQAHLKFWQPDSGFELITQSESPVGGGLGGSSSLCVSLLKAFSLWKGIPLELEELVRLASNLEAQVLKKPTGTQDYFPAAQPGLNLIHYGAQGPQSELLSFDEDLFRQRMLLIYTGRSHHSGINNWQVLKAAIDGESKTLKALRELSVIATEVMQACRETQWDRLPELFQHETAVRTKLSPGFSSPEIVQLEKLALSAGAEAVKICGAGGGGCVIVWTPPLRRLQVEEACRNQGFQILKAAPVVAL